LAYAIVPDWIFQRLVDGIIDTQEAMIWMAIRRYVMDEEKNKFSPPPIDLTNREIAEIAQCTENWARQRIKAMEGKGLLRRISAQEAKAMGLPGHRHLQLLPPNSSYPELELPLREEEEDLTINNSVKPSQDTPPPAPVSAVEKGGPGGKNTKPRTPVTPSPQLPRTPVTPQSGVRGMRGNGKATGAGPDDTSEPAQKRIAMRLRELGVFASPSYEIAERMVDGGITDPDRAEELLRETLEATRAGANSEEQAMARAVSRLKQNAWVTKANAKSEAASKPVTISREANFADRRLWHEALEELERQVTPATHDLLLRNTQVLGRNGGDALVVGVEGEHVLRSVGRLESTVRRGLARVAGRAMEVHFTTLTTVPS
jgi:hypothetical protein